MAMREREKELLGLKGKINALSAMLRLGHEAFEKNDLKSLSIHIVNNTKLIVPFLRAAFVDMRGEFPKILSLTGHSDVNSNSEYVLNLLNLMRAFHGLSKPVALTFDGLKDINAPKCAFEAMEFLTHNERKIMLIPFLPLNPNHKSSPDEQLFILVVEFEFEDELKSASTLLPLLCRHYNEALRLQLAPKKNIMPGFLSKRHKWFSLKRIILAVAALFIISLVTVPVRQNVAAEFEIVPGKENIYYAPFDGFIKECFFQNGKKVMKDNVVLCYDTKELEYKINEAKKEYDEISAELEMIRQQSFSDVRLRGQVRLLELKKARAKVNIDRNEWYLSKSKIKAKQKGILDIVDSDALEGKAVRSGDQLFEILSSSGLIAEVQLNEQDASVMGREITDLSKDTDISLYLHSRPEYKISGKVVSVSPRPILTSRKTYCYIIKMELDNPPKNLIYGMRGIARVSGGRVLLGQYLFRNLVLWWRKV